ncbi:hypothetical protein BAUCODRAFT_410032 [Baudoinia panamericana UAMH 10762]|uniref:ASST-domain-containing protein n=1 Tax=Baudoinia panamericana (strain UAMH 10762) TaxID=717646 RepID=M2LTY4_BAUPA|nr:uncharacterized protein BAUCODRAFT_410032 [Baudoinia panamericana UAMH 10762]EMC97987.1 hypothetical protein BAUCODRAFT_410032 [Baudoinia panamericana UAMH 10762]
MSIIWKLCAPLVLYSLTLALGASNVRWDDGALSTFITRPDLKPPKLRVAVHDAERVTPGYLFIAPYSHLVPASDMHVYSTHQIGPHIYDQAGRLVWSGAGLFPNRVALDFKKKTLADGAEYLTFIAYQSFPGSPFERGAGIALDSAYRMIRNVTIPLEEGSVLDVHEFTLVDNGQSALLATSKVVLTSVGPASGNQQRTALIMNAEVQEVNISSGQKKFVWSAIDHISTNESTSPMPNKGSFDKWDYLHLNSVEKTVNGDYLISARHTDAVYLVSGIDGSIIWRLGGTRSSFVMEGFNFSRQHDARLLAQNDTITVVSLLDNAADESLTNLTSSSCSSLLTIALHTAVEPKRAILVSRISRPDEGLSRLRGNMQTLPGGNVLGGWSEQGWITEHAPNGDLVYEAAFASDRFCTYRAFKFDWTASPAGLPVASAFASTTSRGEHATVIHVSWNGATEVKVWNFFTTDDGVHSPRRIGNAEKAGFETSVVIGSHFATVFAEAIDGSGRSLANSTMVNTELPLGWRMDFSLPAPERPSSPQEASADKEPRPSTEELALLEQIRESNSAVFSMPVLLAVVVLCPLGLSLSLRWCVLRRRTRAQLKCKE